MKIKDVFHINKWIVASMLVVGSSVIYATSLLKPVLLTLPINEKFNTPKISLDLPRFTENSKPIVFIYQNQKMIKQVGVKKFAKKRSYKNLSKILKNKVTNERFEVVVPRLKIEMRTDKKFLAYLLKYKNKMKEHRYVKLNAPLQKSTNKKLVAKNTFIEQNIETKQSALVKNQAKSKNDLVIYEYKTKKDMSSQQSVPKLKLDSQIVNVASKKTDKLVKQRKLLDTMIEEQKVEQKNIGTVNDSNVVSLAEIASTPVSSSVSSAIESLQKPLTKKIIKHESAPTSVEPHMASQKLTTQNPPLQLASKSLDLSELTSQDGDGFLFSIRNKEMRIAFVAQQFSSFVETKEGYKAIDLTSHSVGQAEIMYDKADILPTFTKVHSNNTNVTLPELTIEKIEELLGHKIEHQTFLLISHIGKERAFDIDGEYDQHFALDANFNKTADNIQYELFVGLRPGNRIIRYMAQQKQEVEEIVTVSEESITYIEIDPVPSYETKLKIITKNKTSEVNVTQEAKVEYYNKKLNLYHSGGYLNFLLPQKNKHSNDYIRIDYNNRTFYYVMQRDQHTQSVELLDDYSVDGLYDFMDITHPKDYCVIQYNLTESIEKMTISLRDGLNTQQIEAVYLDSDGQFYDEPSANSRMAFVLTDRVGTVNIITKYIKDKSQVAHSLCQPGSYFIQNL